MILNKYLVVERQNRCEERAKIKQAKKKSHVNVILKSFNLFVCVGVCTLRQASKSSKKDYVLSQENEHQSSVGSFR